MVVRLPSIAERARTVVRAAGALDVCAPDDCDPVDLHGVEPDGSIVLVPHGDHPLVTVVREDGPEVDVRLRATDVCPVQVADRVRAHLVIVGRAHEPPPHLRRELAAAALPHPRGTEILDVGFGRTVLYVTVTGLELTENPAPRTTCAVVLRVPVDEYAIADPDPLTDWEAELLAHLVGGHADELRRLTRLAPAAVRRGAERVAPVRVDRSGLVLRISGAAGAADVRLRFPEPLTCLHQLAGLMKHLLDRADAAGHR